MVAAAPAMVAMVTACRAVAPVEEVVVTAYPPEALVVGVDEGCLEEATTVVVAEEVAGMVEEAGEVVATAAAVWAAQAKVAAAEAEAVGAEEMAVEEVLMDTLAGALADTTAAEARAREVAAKEAGGMEVAALEGVVKAVVAVVG
eukprot:4768859-Prymnesium_polylepis.1